MSRVCVQINFGNQTLEKGRLAFCIGIQFGIPFWSELMHWYNTSVQRPIRSTSMAPEWQNGVDISIGIVHTLQSDLSLLARLRFHALNPLTSTLPFYIVLGTHWALCPPISISKQTVQLGLSLWGSPKERITSFQLSQPRVLSWDEQGALLFVAAIKITISFSIRRGLSLSLSLSQNTIHLSVVIAKQQSLSSPFASSAVLWHQWKHKVFEPFGWRSWRGRHLFVLTNVLFSGVSSQSWTNKRTFVWFCRLFLSLSLSLSPSEWTTSAELSMSQAKI